MGKKVVMIGATGAVGSHCAQHLAHNDDVLKLTLLGRRTLENLESTKVSQHKANIFNTDTYREYLSDHETAICTLGVGEPSKISQEDFIKIDKTAVVDFAKACKAAGIKHFSLLSSVGADSTSKSFYLRVKGELIDALEDLQFDRLSIFQPSMIITPTNRYGFTQAVTLAVWPVIDKLFFGGLKKLKGIKVDILGQAIAQNIFQHHSGLEKLHWESFKQLTAN